MKKILVPLDGSEFADRILARVAQVLGKEPGQVTLLHVAPQQRADADRSASERLSAQQDPAKVRAHLEEVRGRLQRAGATVAVVERSGEPAQVILQTIADERPDLVAMCSHARGAFMRWLRGSVSGDVLGGARAPVLVITPRTAPEAPASEEAQALRRILVPLDGSEDAGKVLGVVEALAKQHDAEVVLARVAWEGLSRPLLASVLSTEHLLEGLKPWADRLAAAGVRVRCVAEHGDIAGGVVALADREDVDLIAMTTHEHSRLLLLIEGSVTERVLARSHRPLLVVHA